MCVYVMKSEVEKLSERGFNKSECIKLRKRKIKKKREEFNFYPKLKKQG